MATDIINGNLSISNDISDCSIMRGKAKTCITKPVINQIEKTTGISASTPCELVEKAAENLGCKVEDKVGKEKCVLKKLSESGKIDPEIVRKELKNNYKISGPTNTDLLSNIEIDKFMRQIAHFYPKFFACPFAMVDFVNYGHFLSKMSIEQLYPRYDTFGCVINSDLHTGGGKHWMALYIDMRGREWTVEFFNSSGNRPVMEWQDWQIRIKNEMEKLIPKVKAAVQPQTANIVNVTKIKHQKSRTECGLYSLYYILCRTMGIKWDKFTNIKVPDSEMMKFRQHLFVQSGRKKIKKFNFDEYKNNTDIKWE